MADLKAARIHYILELSHDEFALMFRAVGYAAGATKVRFRPDETQALRDLNVKMATIREHLLREAQAVAMAALGSAQDLARQPLPLASTETEGKDGAM
jgi:hypothetical protein